MEFDLAWRELYRVGFSRALSQHKFDPGLSNRLTFTEAPSPDYPDVILLTVRCEDEEGNELLHKTTGRPRDMDAEQHGINDGLSMVAGVRNRIAEKIILETIAQDPEKGKRMLEATSSKKASGSLILGIPGKDRLDLALEFKRKEERGCMALIVAGAGTLALLACSA